MLGAKNRYKGPIRQIEFDEGMGIVEEKPVEPDSAAAARKLTGATRPA